MFLAGDEKAYGIDNLAGLPNSWYTHGPGTIATHARLSPHLRSAKRVHVHLLCVKLGDYLIQPRHDIACSPCAGGPATIARAVGQCARLVYSEAASTIRDTRYRERTWPTRPYGASHPLV